MYETRRVCHKSIIQARKSARRSIRNAKPQGVKGDATPLGAPADLQSASSESAASRIWRYEKPTAADCKSALKWSNLFCLRISNPQERLADSRISGTPYGLAFSLVPSWLAYLRNALRALVFSCALRAFVSLMPNGTCCWNSSFSSSHSSSGYRRNRASRWNPSSWSDLNLACSDCCA